MISCPIYPADRIPFFYLVSQGKKPTDELFFELFRKNGLSACVYRKENGQPYGLCEKKEIALTASHSGGTTVVACSAEIPYLGADLQTIVDWSNEEKRRLAFSERELRSANEDPTRLTFLWAAKEAALKALGIGLGKGFRYLEVITDFSSECALSFADGYRPPFVDPTFYSLPLPQGPCLIFTAGRDILST